MEWLVVVIGKSLLLFATLAAAVVTAGAIFAGAV